MTFLGIRRRRESEPHAAEVAAPAHVRRGRGPALSNGGAGRFARAAARTSGAGDRGRRVGPRTRRGRERGRGDAPKPRSRGGLAPAGRSGAGRRAGPAGSPPDPPAGVDGGDRMAPQPTASRASASSPRRRHGDAGAVPLRSSGRRPDPRGAGDDRRRGGARGHARGRGWKALPPGHSWYAKRFAWEPAATGPLRSAAPAAGAPARGGSRCCACCSCSGARRAAAQEAAMMMRAWRSRPRRPRSRATRTAPTCRCLCSCSWAWSRSSW